MTWTSGEVINTQTRLRRLSQSFPFQYAIHKIGTDVYGECLVAGGTEYGPDTAQNVFANVLPLGYSVYIYPDTYTLTSDITITDENYMNIKSNYATIQGAKIIFHGTGWDNSKLNSVSGINFSGASAGVKFTGGGLAPKVEDCRFYQNTTGIEFQNTTEWIENWQLRNLYFYDCTTGIQFTTPSGGGTASHQDGRGDQIYIDLRTANQTGIVIQNGCSVSSGAITNLMIWLHVDPQIGIQSAGNTPRMWLMSPTFESQTGAGPAGVYGIQYTAAATYPFHLLGPLWSGYFTGRINNLASAWLFGPGTMRKQTAQSIAIGLNGVYGAASTFSAEQGFATAMPRIHLTAGGVFAGGEVITVKIETKTVDHNSMTTTKTFNATGDAWLDDDDYLALMPSCNQLYNFQVSAKTTEVAATTVTMTLDWYGIGC